MDALTIQCLVALGIRVPEKFFGHRIEHETKLLIENLELSEQQGVLRDTRTEEMYRITSQPEIQGREYLPPLTKLYD